MNLLPQRKSFDKARPWLQHTWDSSSLSAFMRCARRYFYSIICGFRPKTESIDLRFGTLVHKAMEAYELRHMSRGHDEAQVVALQELLKEAWDGEAKRYWTSTSNNKNLWNAIRALIWYTEQFRDDSERTTMIGEKLYAIELPFQFGLGIESPSGEELTYSGHIDRIVDSIHGRWVVDYKTTTKTVNTQYFDTYQPSTQLPGYAVAAKVVFKEPIYGVRIDAFQIGVDFVRVGRGHILMGEEKSDEWLAQTRGWIRLASHIAASKTPIEANSLAAFAAQEGNAWPMNTESCFTCTFKAVCGSTPSIRGHLLENSFQTSFWDPIGRDK